jgi:predicted glycogen debranching enzyme
MNLKFDGTTCQDLEKSSRLEWLETNGLGGFASGTISGIHTRRYHGLLTSALHPPAGRMLLVAKFEDALIVDGQRVELSANRYDGAVHPQGYEYVREFRLDPFPTWVYEIGSVQVEKRVFMVHGSDATVVEYEVKGLCKNCHLEVRPLVAYRDYHATTHSNAAIDSSFEWEEEGLVSVQLYDGLPRVYFGADYSRCEPTGHWYNRFEYAEEKARGLDFQEDLFQPFVLHFDLADSPKAVVIVSRVAIPAHEATALREQERLRRLALRRHAPAAEPFLEDLAEAADQFVVRRGGGHTIIAGYPWFGDWGRDTMIALPGLTLVTGRHDVARGILREFAKAFNQGMLPNRFSGADESPEYNTADTALWFFEAARAYLHYTNDQPFARDVLYPRLAEAMDWHLAGTRYGIRADADGLLLAGEPGVQLTWMDAKIGDWVVTPRHGKPVEIQALWYNAIRTLREFALRFGDLARVAQMEELAHRAQQSFLDRFWDAERGYLLDNTGDAAIRPNQIFAVSLHFSMLDSAQAWGVVDTVERHLLTPLGLRSLSPEDSAYRGIYTGGVHERDSAYHQGPVWLWLMGPFLTAYARVYPGSPRLRELLNGMQGHLREAGVGQMSEIADGDAPFMPGGCFAQAWSVAELLRAAAESIGTKIAPAPDRMASPEMENERHAGSGNGSGRVVHVAGVR